MMDSGLISCKYFQSFLSLDTFSISFRFDFFFLFSVKSLNARALKALLRMTKDPFCWRKSTSFALQTTHNDIEQLVFKTCFKFNKNSLPGRPSKHEGMSFMLNVPHNFSTMKMFIWSILLTLEFSELLFT